MNVQTPYRDYEVGAGRVDPLALGRGLAARVLGRRDAEASFLDRWLGPAAGAGDLELAARATRRGRRVRFAARCARTASLTSQP